jgi:formate dehydrogenase iron-sulfur subunit
MAIEASRISLQTVIGALVGNKTVPLPQQTAMGFFTDTSLCIGCKACEVACKQWNELPASEQNWTGSSYDNTGQLSATTWRHVQFIEHIGRREGGLNGYNGTRTDIQSRVTQARDDGLIPFDAPGTALPFFNTDRWLMMSDVCKHCAPAPCQEACPTDSIQFGEVEKLKAHARARLGILHARGVKEARLYGVDDHLLEGGLNSSFLLLDEPEVYNLPTNPTRPSTNVVPASLWTILAAMILGGFGIMLFRGK